MKCRRKGCANVFKGKGASRVVTVIDERLLDRGMEPERKEVWCLECCGHYEPNKYTLVYSDRGYKDRKGLSKLTMHRIEKAPEDITEDIILTKDRAAPIVEGVTKSPADIAKMLKEKRIARSKEFSEAPIQTAPKKASKRKKAVAQEAAQ